MPEYLFDTTVLVDNFRGKSVVVPFVQPILDGTATVWFSVITEAELWAGIKSPYERVRYEALLSMMKRIPVTKTIARIAGELYGTYRHQGLSLPDALIAATARVYKKTLLTRNIKHFELLRDEISCEFYS
jgi:predicted nucleic acid-binding protein